MKPTLSCIFLLGLVSSSLSAAVPALTHRAPDVDATNRNNPLPPSVLKAYNEAISSGSFIEVSLDAGGVSTNGEISTFSSICQTSEASPWWYDARDILQNTANWATTCEQQNSHGCTEFGRKGSAGVGICGEQGNNMGCWEAYQVGLALINRCRKASGKIGGYARMYTAGRYNEYLDLLIYHS